MSVTDGYIFRPFSIDILGRQGESSVIVTY
jgi:hypothetical protein